MHPILISSSSCSYVFGTQPLKRIFYKKPFVKANRVRVRMRNTEFAKVFVKTDNGITKHYVIDCGDHWELTAPICLNKTIV